MSDLTWRRPVSTWWWLRKRTYFVFVMRELSSLFVAWFVVYLLLLVRAVTQGDAAYHRFLHRADSPVLVVINVIGFVFIVNVPGWEAAETFANPMDGQNLNRIFPGNTSGTVSFVMAHRVVELLANWGKWHIDMHGGDASEWLNPFAIYHRTGKAEVDSVSEQIAHLWDTEVIWSMTHQGG